jgi:hypothetical protein
MGPGPYPGGRREALAALRLGRRGGGSGRLPAQRGQAQVRGGPSRRQSATPKRGPESARRGGGCCASSHQLTRCDLTHRAGGGQDCPREGGPHLERERGDGMLLVLEPLAVGESTCHTQDTQVSHMRGATQATGSGVAPCLLIRWPSRTVGHLSGPPPQTQGSEAGALTLVPVCA